jgi:L-ascorbate metabolism protein UlaG (beta-lactamase superfamily)
MRIHWYGQSASLLEGSKRVLIDPFGALGETATARGFRFDYPPIEPVEVDLLLITHEHADHNAAELATGEPVTIRSTAGTFDSPVGEVVAVASEHDDAAGTVRGPNAIFRFELDALRVCHLGDLGQQALGPEQVRAIGEVDVLFVPAGGGPTGKPDAAGAIARRLGPRLVVPMHFGTPAVDFLDPPGAFLNALALPVSELEDSEVDTAEFDLAEPRAVVLAAPLLTRT